MTPINVRTVLMRMASFERAVRAHEFRGGGDPDDIPQIEAEYERAKLFLEVGIKELGKRD